jgi:hypothetical protein
VSEAGGGGRARTAALVFAREAAGDRPEAIALVERMAKIPEEDDESFFTLEADLARLLEPSPTLGLRRRPALGEVEAALRVAIASLNGADPLARETRRRELAEELRGLGVQHPLGLVDAALAAKYQKVAAAAGQGHQIEMQDPEPWPDMVDGAELLSAIAALQDRHVVLPEGGAEVVALFIVGTYAPAAFDHAPYLALCSPTHRCGKSTEIAVVAALARRALPAGNVSGAALFRVIEQVQPTLLIDEADRIPEDSDLWQLLNAGHTKGTPVWRIVGENLEPRCFSVFGPKVLSYIRPTRSPLPTTLEDRTIRLTLQRKRRSEPREKLRTRALEQAAGPIRRRLARWVADHGEQLESSRPPIPEDLDDRAADCWEPLIAVADLAGGRWPDLARHLAVRFSADRAGEEAESPGVLLLADLAELLDSGDLAPDDHASRATSWCGSSAICRNGRGRTGAERETGSPPRRWRASCGRSTSGQNMPGRSTAGSAAIRRPRSVRRSPGSRCALRHSPYKARTPRTTPKGTS